MPVETGTVVRSLAGHDAGKLFVVVSESKKAVLLADGKHRPLESPKRKNLKHIRKTNQKLDLSGAITNKKLRQALCALEKQEGGIELV